MIHQDSKTPGLYLSFSAMNKNKFPALRLRLATDSLVGNSAQGSPGCGRRLPQRRQQETNPLIPNFPKYLYQKRLVISTSRWQLVRVVGGTRSQQRDAAGKNRQQMGASAGRWALLLADGRF